MLLCSKFTARHHDSWNFTSYDLCFSSVIIKFTEFDTHGSFWYTDLEHLLIMLFQSGGIVVKQNTEENTNAYILSMTYFFRINFI